MKELIEQLESNYKAITDLENRYTRWSNSDFYTIFSRESKREKDLKWILKVQKRVLRMRYRILENIRMETEKQMHLTSQMSKQINLK